MHSDVQFFSENQILDYSLLLGIMELTEDEAIELRREAREERKEKIL